MTTTCTFPKYKSPSCKNIKGKWNREYLYITVLTISFNLNITEYTSKHVCVSHCDISWYEMMNAFRDMDFEDYISYSFIIFVNTTTKTAWHASWTIILLFVLRFVCFYICILHFFFCLYFGKRDCSEFARYKCCPLCRPQRDSAVTLDQWALSAAVRLCFHTWYANIRVSESSTAGGGRVAAAASFGTCEPLFEPALDLSALDRRPR